jgi:hypothetical protein
MKGVVALWTGIDERPAIVQFLWVEINAFDVYQCIICFDEVRGKGIWPPLIKCTVELIDLELSIRKVDIVRPVNTVASAEIISSDGSNIFRLIFVLNFYYDPDTKEPIPFRNRVFEA